MEPYSQLARADAGCAGDVEGGVGEHVGLVVVPAVREGEQLDLPLPQPCGIVRPY